MAVNEDPSATPGRGVDFAVREKKPPLARFAIVVARLVVAFWFRPQVRGAEHMPSEGPVILAPVHRSFADFAFSVIVTRRPLYFMAKDSLWRSRLLGWFLLSVGAFPVHRDAVDREAMDHAQEVLHQGMVLLMFPEGTRQLGPKVAELHDGVAFLAARCGAKIVPLGIGGSDLAMPKGTKVPKRLPITLVVGQPLAPPPKGPRGRVARSQVQQTTAALHQAIQEVYDQARS